MSEASASPDPAILKNISWNKQLQTAPQELDKVLSIMFYAEVTKRNRDTNGLESLKIIQIATERYLKEKTLYSWASCKSRKFHNSKEIHSRIAPAAPQNSFSKDNEMSQLQPQKKGRSSIIDSGDENRTSMHEEAVFIAGHLACYAWMSFRHTTSFCILNNMSKRFRFRYF